MRKINIYSPTYHREDVARQFIPSLIKSIERSNYDTKAFIADNNSPQSMKDWLKTQSNEKLEIHLLDKNYGKGEAINTLHRNVRKSDYIISLDSDILCQNEDNWIDRYIDILEADDEIGIVSARFQERVSHGYKALNKTRVVNGNNLVYGSTIIGGACFAMKTATFDITNGYNSKDIYAGDDGCLVGSCTKNKKIVAVCMDTELYHVDDDPEFRKWKIDKMKKFKDNKYEKTPNSGYYENL